MPMTDRTILTRWARCRLRQAASDRFSTLTISLLLALTVGGSVTVVAAPPRPNLLFILTDEQRHDTLRAYGNDAIQTPHLDRLAGEGVVFKRAYVSQPVCSPARSTILTGLWPHQSGVTMNNISLRKETRTLPELLDDPLYRSVFMGKWHLGSELEAQHGFDDWVSIEDGYTLQTPEKSTYHHWLIERGHTPDTRHGTFSREFSNRLPLEHSKTTFLEQRVDEFLEKNRKHPFVLYVSFLHPHTPNFGPLDSLYSPDDVQLAPTINAPLGNDAPRRYQLMRAARKELTRAQWKEEIARYWGLVTQVDRSVGAILEKLKELDLEETTIVAFTSEHGKQMGEHGLWYKGVMYEASSRVPWLIKAPGIAPGVVEPAVSHIDLVPTLLDLMGRPAVPSLPGRSLVPLMQGEATKARDVFLQWHPHRLRSVPDGTATVSKEEIERVLGESTRTIVTQQGWKLSLSDVDRAQLFHLETDPHETRNLFSTQKHEREVANLSRRISAWQKAVGDPLALPGSASGLRDGATGR